jgi:hypothetical protein
VSGQSYAIDAAPFISNGRILVLACFLADALGAQTSWDQPQQQVTALAVSLESRLQRLCSFKDICLPCLLARSAMCLYKDLTK